MDTKKLTRLAGLCAICVITRIYLKLIPNVQILSDIILILAINGKLDESLIVNATTMIITSFFLGFGYWVIFQVLDFGILGISNYMIFNCSRDFWIYLWIFDNFDASFFGRWK